MRRTGIAETGHITQRVSFVCLSACRVGTVIGLDGAAVTVLMVRALRKKPDAHVILVIVV